MHYPSPVRPRTCTTRAGSTEPQIEQPTLRLPGREPGVQERGAGRTDAPAPHASPVRAGPGRAGDRDPRRGICEEIREHLVRAHGANRVRRYLSASTRIRPLPGGGVEVAAGDLFTLDMIQRRLGEAIRIAAQFVLAATEPTVRFVVDASLHGATTPTTGAPSGEHANQPTTHPLATRIGAPATRHARQPTCPTLERFIVGATNRLAFESVRRAVESGIPCPPVFVHGSCGVGKTHLLRGATMHARRLRPGCRVRYTTGEAFTNAFVTAIRTRTIEAFQKKYRGLDLLCIDDIHLMAGKQATQHELLQVFNTLSLGGARIILASDAHPREIARLDQALASRFASGLVVRVDDPDPELAARLVTHIAHKRGMFLDDAAVRTIVERVGIGRGASVRDLEGAVLQIQAVARLLDKGAASPASATGSISPTMGHIRQALSLRRGDDEPSRRGPASLESIISGICAELSVSGPDLRGKGRQKKVVLARELIVHIARATTSKSFPEIAHAIGRPNHSTVITAAKRFKDRLAAAEPVRVGCPHDGVPAAELTQLLISRIARA